MNGIKNTTAQSGWHHLVKALFVAGVLVLTATSPTKANALQTEWNDFLAGGKTEWASTPAPPITLQIKEDIAQALVPTNPLSNIWVQYLEWRRDLDPTRFDFYHPLEGPYLAGLTTPPTINPQPQQLTPPTLPPPTAAPEPNTLALAVALAGAGLWWRRARPARSASS